MPQSFARIYCHVIFSTKSREPLVQADVAPRLYAYIGGTAREIGTRLLAAGGMPDHVHLLISLGRRTTLADAVRDLKSNSSRWIHQTFDNLRGFGWQNGYGGFSVSHSNIDDVKRYIAGQADHHRGRSFKEEFRALLKRHGIEFDERYVWD